MLFDKCIYYYSSYLMHCVVLFLNAMVVGVQWLGVGRDAPNYLVGEFLMGFQDVAFLLS